MFLKEVASRNSSSSSSEPALTVAQWKKFWTAPVMPRCKETSWRAWVGALPVRVALHQRGIDLDPSCAICGGQEETINHLFLECAAVRATWFGSGLGIRMQQGTGFHEFLTQVLQAYDSEGVAQVQAMVCAVWEARNRAVF